MRRCRPRRLTRAKVLIDLGLEGAAACLLSIGMHKKREHKIPQKLFQQDVLT